jgi:hypothetical protein
MAQPAVHCGHVDYLHQDGVIYARDAVIAIRGQSVALIMQPDPDVGSRRGADRDELER